MKKFLLLFVVLVVFACEKHDTPKTLNETEYYFDEKLSSISLGDDGSFWVGSEIGDLFYFRDDYRYCFDLKEDKIYKVVPDFNERGDTVFWIAIRNSGLQRWIKEEAKELRKTKTYKIDHKEDKFSPYDLLTIGSRMYVATSQGLFYLDKDADTDRLTLIYSSEEYLSKQKNNTFLIHNLVNYKDRYILCATQNGVLVYDILKKETGFRLLNNHIQHVSVYDDTIYMVTNDYLYLGNFDGEILRKIKVENSPRVYYQVKKVHYLIGTDEIVFSKNQHKYIDIPLRRFVPMSCRNIVLPDTVNNFTYLLTENAVWRIPNSVDVFKSNKHIKLSCTSEGKIYFLSFDNELYVQNEQNEEARWIYTFEKDNIINWMQVVDGELYFCNVDNEFRKIRLSDSWMKNIFCRKAQNIYTSKARINTVKSKKMGTETRSFLGTQSGLLSVNRQGVADTLSEFSGMYITAMFGHEYSGKIYIATLNNGVFCIYPNDIVRKVAGTDNRYFVQDIIATNDHNANLIMLTNQQIISLNPADSIKAKGYQKLLYLNDTTFYALPQFGIHKFTISKGKICDDGIAFKNIQFTGVASFSAKGQMVLGSTIGALNVPADEHKPPVWSDFNAAFDINILYFIFTIALVLLIAGIALTLVVKKQNVTEIHIKKQRDDLNKQIVDLLSYSHIFEEKDQLKQLQNLIMSVDARAKDVRSTKEKLDGYSLRLAQLNREIGLRIPDKLSMQIDALSKTEGAEAELLLTESEAALKTRDTQRMNSRIKQNTLWIGQRGTLISEIEDLLTRMGGTAEIEHVNSGIYDRLVKIRNNINLKPISESTADVNRANKEVEAINSLTRTTEIEQYLDTLTRYLRGKEEESRIFAFLTHQLNEVIARSVPENNILTLTLLKPIQDQVLVLQHLDAIKKKTELYKEQYAEAISKNESLINKKFDKELANAIAASTKNTVSDIHTLISTLYGKICVTDKQIIYDVLKLNNLDGQHARVLALLICNFKIKRTLIPGMLGIYGNLNPVISKIVNDRIRSNERYLRERFQKNKNKTVFICLLLRLLNP